MSTELAALRAGLAPRRSAVGSLLALPVADAAAMLACFGPGGLLNFSYQNVTEERTLILALLIAAALVVFQHFGHYSRRRQLWQELGDIAMVAAVALLFDLALLYLLKVNFSRLWVLTSWALVVPAVPLARLLVKNVALELGHWLQPTVIVGTGPNAREIAAAYDARNNHLGYQVQAFLDPAAPASGGARALVAGRRAGRSRSCPWTRGAQELPGWLGQPHVVVALELDEMLGREGLIESLSFHHGDIDVISPLKGLPINNTRVSHFFSRDILSLRIHNNLARPWPQLVKRAFDLVAASVLLLFLAPLLALVACRIRLADGGGVIFAHTRVGRHGRLFPCYKFRTMVANSAEVLAELLARDPAARAEWAKDSKLHHDPRITGRRPVLAQDQPGRAAAAVQRGARRDEPGRPAAGGARRARALWRGQALLPPGPPGPDRPVADQRPQRHRLRAPGQPRRLVRPQLDPVVRHPDPVPHPRRRPRQSQRRLLRPGQRFGSAERGDEVAQPLALDQDVLLEHPLGALAVAGQDRVDDGLVLGQRAGDPRLRARSCSRR